MPHFLAASSMEEDDSRSRQTNQKNCVRSENSVAPPESAGLVVGSSSSAAASVSGSNPGSRDKNFSAMEVSGSTPSTTMIADACALFYIPKSSISIVDKHCTVLEKKDPSSLVMVDLSDFGSFLNCCRSNNVSFALCKRVLPWCRNVFSPALRLCETFVLPSALNSSSMSPTQVEQHVATQLQATASCSESMTDDGAASNSSEPPSLVFAFTARQSSNIVIVATGKCCAIVSTLSGISRMASTVHAVRCKLPLLLPDVVLHRTLQRLSISPLRVLRQHDINGNLVPVATILFAEREDAENAVDKLQQVWKAKLLPLRDRKPQQTVTDAKLKAAAAKTSVSAANITVVADVQQQQRTVRTTYASVAAAGTGSKSSSSSGFNNNKQQQKKKQQPHAQQQQENQSQSSASSNLPNTLLEKLYSAINKLAEKVAALEARLDHQSASASSVPAVTQTESDMAVATSSASTSTSVPAPALAPAPAVAIVQQPVIQLPPRAAKGKRINYNVSKHGSDTESMSSADESRRRHRRKRQQASSSSATSSNLPSAVRTATPTTTSSSHPAVTRSGSNATASDSDGSL